MGKTSESKLEAIFYANVGLKKREMPLVSNLSHYRQ
jgi:hypothetical protein